MKSRWSNRTQLLVGVGSCALLCALALVVTRSPLAGAQRPSSSSSTETTGSGSSSGAGLRVVGNVLRTVGTGPIGSGQVGSRQVVQLRGVNRDLLDSLCAGGGTAAQRAAHTIFDGPTGAQEIAALRRWHVNAVRLPLNEGCWLGLGALDPATSGAAYQQAVEGEVAQLLAAGIDVVLDLHKVSPHGEVNVHALHPMPDAAYSVTFWRSLAAQYGADDRVVFDLYNEPHDVTWRCWRDGGAACLAATGEGYTAVGMQELVNAVRAAGATNVLLLNGLGWGDDLSGWLAWAPHDPLADLAAGWHVYATDSACGVPGCYTRVEGALTRVVPLIVGEVGIGLYDRTCAIGPSTALIDWLDAQGPVGASYLAFSWNVGAQDCGSLSLIADWNGTPHPPFGTWYQAHLLGRG